MAEVAEVVAAPEEDSKDVSKYQGINVSKKNFDTLTH